MHGSNLMPRERPALAATWILAAWVLMLSVVSPGVSSAQTTPPGNGVVVVLMTGFNAGPNPGLQILESKLQAAFAGGSLPLSSQVFTYTDLAGAAGFVTAATNIGKLVLIGHSWGAVSTFSLAQNQLATAGITVDLAIAVDYVSQTSPFAPTTPTVPVSITRTLNYHQVSTGFLEPVPSSSIIGASRNLNLEVLFDDTGITHTSIDNDDRVHERIILRIEELVLGVTWPGTGEDVDTLCRIDTPVTPCQPGSGLSVTGLLTDQPVQPVSAGDWISLRAISPEGDFTAASCAIVGQVYATASPPTPILPGLASSLAFNAMFAITPASGFQLFPFSLAPMPAAGFESPLCWPANAQGLSVVLQTVVVDPAAGNGFFATSQGIELRGI